jgi:hypothetical protein
VVEVAPVHSTNVEQKPVQAAAQAVTACQHHYRKIVETSASLVERLLPKHIHATYTAGFELKVILFMLALSFDRLL